MPLVCFGGEPVLSHVLRNLSQHIDRYRDPPLRCTHPRRPISTPPSLSHRHSFRVPRGPTRASLGFESQTWANSVSSATSLPAPALASLVEHWSRLTAGAPTLPAASAAVPSSARFSALASLKAGHTDADTATDTMLALLTSVVTDASDILQWDATALAASSSTALFTVAVTAGALCVSFASFIAVGVLLQPRWIISFVRQHQPHILFEHVTQERLVALTIDDGPNGSITHEMLDILREHNARATFFLIGSNIDKYPDLLDRMVEEGHEVANHMMADFPGCLLTTHQFMSSLLEVDGKLQPYFPTDGSGRKTKWFRPGYGFSTPRMQHLAHSHGYRLALGSVFPLDPLFKDWGGALARFCLWKMYPGAIIIIHDRPGQGRQTLDLLRIMLPELKRRGYRVVTLTDLVKSGSTTTTNNHFKKDSLHRPVGSKKE